MSIFDTPPPSRSAPTLRLDLPGHYGLPALPDLNMLVDVLHDYVLLAARAHPLQGKHA